MYLIWHFVLLQILLAADACLFTAFYEHHRDDCPVHDNQENPEIFWYLPKSADSLLSDEIKIGKRIAKTIKIAMVNLNKNDMVPSLF